MIESGSHAEGVSAEDFGLPPGTAIRYEQPAPALQSFFPSYAVLDSEFQTMPRPQEWMLPSWAQIWIVLTDCPIGVKIGNRRYDPLQSAILYGVTSRAMPVTANGGVTIVIDVSPLGWARLFDVEAEALRDRITPLAEVLPQEWVRELVDRLHASDRALDVKCVLDDFLQRRLPRANRDEIIIAQIMRLLADRDTKDLASAAALIGINVRTLRRLSKRYFGFPPKLLLSRVRFMRAVIPMLLGKVPNGQKNSPTYYDSSHFNRDGRRFLGMTPRRFAALPSPYLRAALRARRLVLGNHTPTLDRPVGHEEVGGPILNSFR